MFCIQNRIYILRTVNIVLHHYHFIISPFYTFPGDDSCFFFGGRLKEWIDGGTAVVTASKTTYGNSVRLEIEAILPVSAVVVWKVDSVVIEGWSETWTPISQGKSGGGRGRGSIKGEGGG